MKVLQDIFVIRTGRHPELASIARSPATSEDIRSIFRIVGAVIPSLKTALEWRDGEAADSFFLGYEWHLLRASEISSRLTRLAGSPITLSGEDEFLDVPDNWPVEWVPFIVWNGQIVGIVDARGRDEMPVYGIDPQSGMATRWGASLEEFFESVRRQIQSIDRLSIDQLMSGRTVNDQV